MKTIECYRLERVSDDGNSLCARFATKSEAEKAIPSSGGYRGEVKPETIIIYETAFEWRPTLNKAAANSGLAKLTPEEKAALGL